MSSVHDPISSQIPRNDNLAFHQFFDSWLVQQNQDLEELVGASNDPECTPSSMHGLVMRVLDHYELYYREKSRCAHENVLPMLTPPWRSSFEDSFLWIGGWRPSMGFHLLYSKSGVQLEARLEEVLRGFRIGDLADLTPDQLLRINELQLRIIAEEKEVTEMYAKQQETIAGTSMVELSHEATQKMRMRNGADTTMLDVEVEKVVREEEKGMEGVLRAADELRLKTLKEIVNILTPTQAVHFLTAAAELHLRVHDWGIKKDNVAAAMQQRYIQQQQQQQQQPEENGQEAGAHHRLHHSHHQRVENRREH
ncbi:hypothetical protein MLD38_003248 [Melastoma candidum]|uniref:Uncharacterized protein n=1 Tax=Melastoma candidum TaxID=119954 RepID=A0ACB9S281_9MYRT|nr:hypothetical protein MLD38_003248 [Melastoma candidum]